MPKIDAQDAQETPHSKEPPYCQDARDAWDAWNSLDAKFAGEAEDAEDLWDSWDFLDLLYLWGLWDLLRRLIPSPLLRIEGGKSRPQMLVPLFTKNDICVFCRWVKPQPFCSCSKDHEKPLIRHVAKLINSNGLTWSRIQSIDPFIFGMFDAQQILKKVKDTNNLTEN